MADPEQTRTKTTFYIPKTLLKEVKRYGIDHDKNDTEIFNEAIREYLDRHRKGKSQENRE